MPDENGHGLPNPTAIDAGLRGEGDYVLQIRWRPGMASPEITCPRNSPVLGLMLLEGARIVMQKQIDDDGHVSSPRIALQPPGVRIT
jgi:hypothetical protein